MLCRHLISRAVKASTRRSADRTEILVVIRSEKQMAKRRAVGQSDLICPIRRRLRENHLRRLDTAQWTALQ